LSAPTLAREDRSQEYAAFRATCAQLVADVAGRGTPAFLRAAGEQGLLGVALAEEHGGGGDPDARFPALLIASAAAAGETGLALRLVLHAGVVGPLLDGLPGRSSTVAGVASGATAVALAGLDVGTDRPALQRVRGGWRLEGAVPSVVGAADAELIAVVAQDPDGCDAVLLVPAAVASLGAVDDPLAVPGAGMADIAFHGASVSDADVLGGADLVPRLRADADLWHAVVAVAAGRAALAQTLAYVAGRTVFGSPIGAFDNTHQALAAVDVRLRLAESLLDAGLAARTLAPLAPAAAAALVLGALDASTLAADTGLQLHGGYGYMHDYPIAQAFADAAALRRLAAPGTHRQGLVAAALGLAPVRSRRLNA